MGGDFETPREPHLPVLSLSSYGPDGSSISSVRAWTLAVFLGDLASPGCLQCPSTVQVMPQSDALINRYSKKRKFSALRGYREAGTSEGVGGLNLGAYLK